MFKAKPKINTCSIFLLLLITVISVGISLTITYKYQAEAVSTASTIVKSAEQNTLGCDTTYLLTGFGSNYENYVLVMGTNGNCRVAQSFQLNTDCYVSSASVRLNFPYGGVNNLKGSIYIAIKRADSSGLPIGEALTVGSMRAEGNISRTSYIWNTYWRNMGFNEPILLEKNTSYCFEMRVEPDPGSICTFWTLVSQNEIYDKGCASSNNCSTWIGCENGVGPDLNLELWGCEAQSWSFAIITDLHIGDGMNDYGGVGWNDSGSIGQEFNTNGDPIPSVWNLKIAVGYTNTYKELSNTQFVVIDGDLTDSAEISEFEKANEILNKLNIPWIPTMGNHDVWPYIDNITKSPATEEIGGIIWGPDRYFSIVMQPIYYNFSTKLGVVLNRSPMPIWNSEIDSPYNNIFENFTFNYNGYHFIGLDFNERNPATNNKGVNGNGNVFYANWIRTKTLIDGTWDWFKRHIRNYEEINGTGNNNIILLAHHPLYEYWVGVEMGFDDYTAVTIHNFLAAYTNHIYAQFCGHLHSLGWDVQRYPGYDIVKTDANKDAPMVRIVQVYSNGNIDYDTILPKDAAKFTAYCPVDLIVTDPDGLVISRTENQILDAIYYKWDFNSDGQLETQIWVPEQKPGNYSIQVVPEPNSNTSDTFTLTVSPMEQKWGYTPIVVAQNVTISNIPSEPYTFAFKQRTVTNISYTGALSGYYLDTINLTAVLSTENGSLLSGKTINFMIGNQSILAMTDSNGVATASVILNQTPSQFYYIGYSFDGDMGYLPFYDGQWFEIINKPPVADAGGPYIAYEGSMIILDGSNSYDPDSEIYSYEWDIDGDDEYGDDTNVSPCFTWNDDYNGNISLKVTDYGGATSTDSTTVIVNNVVPIVYAGVDIDNVVVGSPIKFSGDFTDTGILDTHTIEWNFGDGTSVITDTLTPTHTYSSRGAHTVTLNVTDDDGGTGSDAIAITVWSYLFQDPVKGTELRINADTRTFQFLASGYDSGIKKANIMIVTNSILGKSQHIFITHCDSDIFLSADVYGGQNDYCLASLWNKKTWKTYWLYDRLGVE